MRTGSGSGEVLGSWACEEVEEDVVNGCSGSRAKMVVVNPDYGEVVVAGRYLDRILLVLPSVVQVLLATVEGNPAWR